MFTPTPRVHTQARSRFRHPIKRWGRTIHICDTDVADYLPGDEIPCSCGGYVIVKDAEDRPELLGYPIVFVSPPSKN